MLTNQIIGECNTVELILLTGPINGESLLKYFATQRRFAVALLFWISFAVVFFLCIQNTGFNGINYNQS